ncbi:hypothetical protein GGR28_000195 [Lewinella aquimaris]|uniref:Uncharacterized protein n=1 Tax=Neolewinella aquimaris TaxID=1835722 RepID=A0A840DWM3_9BACT|nr:hypothetical protein [Neolewinella aquimaris]
MSYIVMTCILKLLNMYSINRGRTRLKFPQFLGIITHIDLCKFRPDDYSYLDRLPSVLTVDTCIKKPGFVRAG